MGRTAYLTQRASGIIFPYESRPRRGTALLGKWRQWRGGAPCLKVRDLARTGGSRAFPESKQGPPGPGRKLVFYGDLKFQIPEDDAVYYTRYARAQHRGTLTRCAAAQCAGAYVIPQTSEYSVLRYF